MTENGLPVENLLVQLEQGLLQSDVRKSNIVSRLLTEDFIEFGGSGHVFTKLEIMHALPTESSIQFTASHFHTRLLASDVALVTYRVLRHSEPPLETLRSSVWVQKAGCWQMCFHQGTPTAQLP